MSLPQPFAVRRTAVRTAVTLPVTYGESDRWNEGTVVDISTGGLGLTGPALLSPGTEVELRFGVMPKKGHLLAMRAVVRYANGDRMGLEFVNFGAGDHRKMLDTIQRLMANIPPKS